MPLSYHRNLTIEILTSVLTTKKFCYLENLFQKIAQTAKGYYKNLATNVDYVMSKCFFAGAQNHSTYINSSTAK